MGFSLFEYLAPQESFHYGGSIAVESKTKEDDPDGRGTTSVITFPVHHAGKSTPPQIIIGRFALLVCLDYASVTRKSRLLSPKTLKPAV